jgi:transposase
MTRLRGWAPRGDRLLSKVPHGHWRTLTFLAALRCDRIEAPCVIDGPINGDSFRAYVEQLLLPTLKPGDIVIIDNLGSHKAKVIRSILRSAGAKLCFLPPYSPDLNPIEQVFAKLKTLLRKAAERTVQATWQRIGLLLQHFTPQECANYFKNAGYAFALMDQALARPARPCRRSGGKRRGWCKCRNSRRSSGGSSRSIATSRTGSRGAARLLLDAAQPRHILLVLLVAVGKGMPAGAVGHEIQLLGPRRIGGGFERGAAGVGDRPRRQPVDHVGVVGRRLLDLAPLDRPSQ